MDICIGHKSSIEFWRMPDNRARVDVLKRTQRKLPVTVPNAFENSDEDFRGLSFPLDVLVGTQKAKRKLDKFRTHVCREPMPSGSFADAEEGLMVSTPELCFFQMATELSLIRLVELGMEFCGSYSLDAPKADGGGSNASSETIYRQKVLTSTKALIAYSLRRAGAHGQKNASRALQYIADRSASPMETILLMLLTLPYQLGGYGLPKPQLNCRVEPSESARHKVLQPYYSCDLYWPTIKLAVEYDSKEFHPEEMRVRDAKRRLDLATLGIDTVSFTYEQIRNTAEVLALARHLSKRLGKRLRYKEPHFSRTRIALSKTLLSSPHVALPEATGR